MKLKELEQILSSVKPFHKPKLELEQYATDAHIAARMLYVASTTFDDIEGHTVLDLGCGCGMLSISSIIMGAERVLSVDIDQDALGMFQENLDTLEIDENVELLQADVLSLPSLLTERFDCVVLNPPFGTKNNSGIDMKFLNVAWQMTRQSVYTMHKSSTREHILKKAKDWGAEVEVLAGMKFEILNQFKFHKKERVFVDVDLIRLSKPYTDRA